MQGDHQRRCTVRPCLAWQFTNGGMGVVAKTIEERLSADKAEARKAPIHENEVAWLEAFNKGSSQGTFAGGVVRGHTVQGNFCQYVIERANKHLRTAGPAGDSEKISKLS